MTNRISGLLEVPWHAVRLYRLARRLQVSGHPTLAKAVASLNRVFSGIEISPEARIGRGFVIQHGVGLVIGGTAVIGDRCTVHQNVTLGVRRGAALGATLEFPSVGDDVIIYPGAVVVGPIVIGDRAIVGANSTVLHDVPADASVAGSPARVISTRSASAPGNLRERREASSGEPAK